MSARNHRHRARPQSTKPFRCGATLLWASLLTLAGAGCRDHVTTATPKLAAPNAAALTPTTTPERPETVAPPESPQKTTAAQEKTATAESTPIAPQAPREEPNNTGKEAVGETTPAVPTQRLLLLAPGGPWLVGFQLSIDGKTPDERLQQLGHELLAACDTNQDGEVTWEELTLAAPFRSGQFGAMAPQSENARQSFIQERDRNRNKLVDHDEIAGIFSRDGMGLRPFSLVGFRQHSEGLRTRSELYRLLDSNGDGALTTDEWRDASKRLWTRDANDDEHVTPNEFRRVASRPGMMPSRRRGTGPEMAWLIEPQTDWETLLYTLQEVYSSGEPLGPTAFPRTPDLFRQLDKNENERLSLTELKELTSATPHVVWRVDFPGETKVAARDTAPSDASSETPIDTPNPAPTPTSSNEPVLVPVAWSAELGSRDLLQTAGARLRFAVDGLQTQWFVRAAPGGDEEQRASQLLATYDNDKNGYLSDDELEPALANLSVDLAELDANDDKKIDRDELLAMVRRRSVGQNLRIRVQVDEAEDLLFEFLDQDHDGRLNGREIESTPARLASLDVDQSGDLSDGEVPDGWLIAVVRGDAPDRSTPPPEVSRPASSGIPAWFQRMDANGDGQISRREWLGARARFEQLDANGDGHLTWSELQDAAAPR